MDYQTHFNWLVVMASNSGWKAHAWHRAQELDLHYSGIAEALKQHMIGLEKMSESASQATAKPRLVRVK